jgi:hypothetical protein
MPADPQSLRTGQRVRITGPAGSVHGQVLETATPPQLPDIHGAPAVKLVREILDEWGVHQLAMLTYTAAGNQAVMFLALLTDHGWRDLRGRPLTIQETEPCKNPNPSKSTSSHSPQKA